jgi:hypothetical protein
VITLADMKQWGGWVLGAIGVVGMIWNRFGIKSLDVKTDGLLQFRSRADRAEAKLEEQGDIRDRAAQKERNL